jgi:hypothetical protein
MLVLMLATCLTDLVVLDLTILIIFGEEILSYIPKYVEHEGRRLL